MNRYLGVPTTLFRQKLPNELILESSRRIIQALDGRVLLNIGRQQSGYCGLRARPARARAWAAASTN